MSDTVSPSVPEPAPVNSGVEVTRPLVAWLLEPNAEGRASFTRTARLVEARAAFGLEKYGQPLMTLDGRDPVEDALQELGDALQYVQKALMLGADLRPLDEVMRALFVCRYRSRAEVLAAMKEAA